MKLKNAHWYLSEGIKQLNLAYDFYVQLRTFFIFITLVIFMTISTMNKVSKALKVMLLKKIFLNFSFEKSLKIGNLL